MGEQPLPKNFSCNLGSLNLAQFVIDPYTDNARFNIEEFEKATEIAVRALDTIIDENLNKHALEAQRENSYNYRNIGLGIMGYATTLFELGIKYGSGEAKVFTDGLFKIFLKHAVKASIKLADEKGTFPKFDPAVWDSNFIKHNFSAEEIEQLKTKKLRNCSLLSIAPTGSIATMLQVSGGCEPEFALSYLRKTDNLNEYYNVYSQAVVDYCNVKGISTEDIDSGKHKLPDYFVVSKDLNWRDRIEIQAIMQEHVDTAISSTVNLPEDISMAEMEHLYLEAWKQGLKGVTIYRAGCKREGILVEDTTPKEVRDAVVAKKTLPRGYVIDVCDDLIGAKRKITTGCGPIHFEVYSDEITGEPQETFINIGSSGGCERNYQFISRLMSLALRSGVPVEAIVDQAKSIRPCPAYMSRTKSKHDTSPGTSCPDAIGRALKDLYEKTIDTLGIGCEGIEEHCSWEVPENEVPAREEDAKTALSCPECGEEMAVEGGCVVCKHCGYSKCD